MDLIKEIFNNYDIALLNIVPLNGGWLNEKYLIETIDGNKYVLKELSLKKFSEKHLKYLIDTVKLQNYLSLKKVSVPRIILNKNDECVSKFSDGKVFFIQDYIDGYSKEFNELNVDEIYSIGKSLALLHNELKQIDISKFKSEFLKYKSIDTLKLELEIKKKQIDAFSSEIFIQQINSSEKILNDIEKSKFLEEQEIQVIHGDFTPDNIIFENNNVKSIIDLEYARVNCKLQDIGRVILSTSLYKNEINFEKLENFIKGYSTISKIENDQIVNSIKMVWINEFDIWMQDRYFKKYNPPKVDKFINEIIWISENWFELEDKIGCVKKYELKKN